MKTEIEEFLKDVIEPININFRLKVPSKDSRYVHDIENLTLVDLIEKIISQFKPSPSQPQMSKERIEEFIEMYISSFEGMGITRNEVRQFGEKLSAFILSHLSLVSPDAQKEIEELKEKISLYEQHTLPEFEENYNRIKSELSTLKSSQPTAASAVVLPSDFEITAELNQVFFENTQRDRDFAIAGAKRWRDLIQSQLTTTKQQQEGEKDKRISELEGENNKLREAVIDSIALSEVPFNEIDSTHYERWLKIKASIQPSKENKP